MLRGAAAKRTYAFEPRVIRFGRGEDHAELSGRSRRNDIAFLDDEDEVNRTVARAQAHLEFDAERKEFRLFDDGSSNGTRIVRDADIITVTPHGPRGVRVASGDILEFGRARVRFEIEPSWPIRFRRFGDRRGVAVYQQGATNVRCRPGNRGFEAVLCAHTVVRADKRLPLIDRLLPIFILSSAPRRLCLP